MITDERARLHYEALKRAVRPGDIVVDIGAGTGIFSLFAAKLGAKRVYAIEPSDWLDLIEPLAKANDCAEQIIPIKQMSQSVTLPEQADVIIGDLRGTHPLTVPHMGAIADARRRFLKPNGILIPQRDRVFATLIEEPELYQKTILEPWQNNEFLLDLTAALPYIRNTIIATHKREFEKPLFPGQVWADIDHMTSSGSGIKGKLEWIADKPGTAHFLVFWFEGQLFGDIHLNTNPWNANSSMYGYSLPPLQEPLEFAANDQIVIQIQADLVENRYIFSWNTTLKADAGHGLVKAAFRQSTFMSSMLSEIRGGLFGKRKQ